LELPYEIPNLAVFTATGRNGADEGYVFTPENIEWTWTKALEDAFRKTQLIADNDGILMLNELYSYILENDYAATNGISTHPDRPRIYSHPGFSYGSNINPDRVSLVEI